MANSSSDKVLVELLRIKKFLPNREVLKLQNRLQQQELLKRQHPLDKDLKLSLWYLVDLIHQQLDTRSYLMLPRLLLEKVI